MKAKFRSHTIHEEIQFFYRNDLLLFEFVYNIYHTTIQVGFINKYKTSLFIKKFYQIFT